MNRKIVFLSCLAIFCLLIIDRNCFAKGGKDEVQKTQSQPPISSSRGAGYSSKSQLTSENLGKLPGDERSRKLGSVRSSDTGSVGYSSDSSLNSPTTLSSKPSWNSSTNRPKVSTTTPHDHRTFPGSPTQSLRRNVDPVVPMERKLSPSALDLARRYQASLDGYRQRQADEEAASRSANESTTRDAVLRSTQSEPSALDWEYKPIRQPAAPAGPTRLTAGQIAELSPVQFAEYMRTGQVQGLFEGRGSPDPERLFSSTINSDGRTQINPVGIYRDDQPPVPGVQRPLTEDDTYFPGLEAQSTARSASLQKSLSDWEATKKSWAEEDAKKQADAQNKVNSFWEN